MDFHAVFEVLSGINNIAWEIYSLFLLVCAFAAVVMLVFSLINKNARSRKMEFLYISNRVLLSGYIAYGLIFILHIGFLIVYIRSLRAGEFVGGEYSLSGDWRRVLPLLVCLQLPFLFLWRSLRTKTWLTIFVAASALIALYYERIVVFLTGFLRDYVPSSWSYYHDRSNTWWFILAGLPAYFAIIYVLAGERARKRGDTF